MEFGAHLPVDVGYSEAPMTAPQLLAYAREQELIVDAQAQGWTREVERHTCVAQRIEHLLAELGEPCFESLTQPLTGP
jgi:hypothetical protein